MNCLAWKIANPQNPFNPSPLMRPGIIAVLILIVAVAGCTPSAKELKLQAEIDSLKKARTDNQGQQRSMINGTVFVVARNGTNFKLALVPITVSSKSEYDAAREKVAVNLKRELDSLASEYKHATEQQSGAYGTLEREYTTYHKLDQQVASLIKQLQNSEESGMIVDTVGERISIMTRQPSMPLVPGMYPSEPSVATAERLVEVSTERKREGERVKPFIKVYDDAYQRRVEIRARAQKLEAAILPALMECLTAKNGIAAKSDADGLFSVSVDPASEVILTGYGRRSVGDDEEKYFWKAQVRPGQLRNDAKIFLSNNELIDPAAEFPALVGRQDVDFPAPEYQYFATASGTFRIERF